ncbi:MAG: Mur ligase family protein [Patescibacteria group bacterium]
MRKLLQFILRVLAKRVIARYRPTVVCITGSVGKTTTKEAIYAVLSSKFWVRKNIANFNNEFGVPLTVIGVDPSLSTAKLSVGNLPRLLKFWSELLKASFLFFNPFKVEYPEILVLEIAAAKPGDIDYLTDIVQPSVGVVTAVGELPVHVEFYSGPQEVIKEKSRLIESLVNNELEGGFGGLAVLNYDERFVLDMKHKSTVKVTTFGLVDSPGLIGPDIWASDISYFMGDNTDEIGGLSFKLGYAGGFVPVRIGGLVGTHQVYGFLAAASVGLHFGINLVDISGAFEKVELPYHRMNLMRGIKNSFVIDDTYNASPLSMHAALDTLRDFAKAQKFLGVSSAIIGRRIAVLGDMRELGKYGVDAHNAIGNFAVECCDILVTVGAAGKIIADAALGKLSGESVFSFNTSEEAKLKVREIIKEGDVILVKGSRSMKMEVVVDEIVLK